MNTPELLAPAGTPEALNAAIAEGADAVYMGLKNFNARIRSSNFAYNQLEAAVDMLHSQRKKVYVTVNTVFEEREADRMYQLLQYLERVGPDAIIVQDVGVLELVRSHFPGLKVHASTQMNIASAQGANFVSRYGVKRVVLARELKLEEIKAVRSNTNIELETFVHGALCVSVSGLCLFSSYLGGRSANRGTCTQACRRFYETEGSADGFLFSPKDFELIEYIPELAEAGVNALKIEGRMKSAEYVGTVVAAYRYMLDNWRFDRERALNKAKSILESDFARKKTTYWFTGTLDPAYIEHDQAGGTGISLGKVRSVRVIKDKRWMLVDSYNGLAPGDSLRIHRHADMDRQTAKIIDVRDTADGTLIQLNAHYNIGDEVYIIQTKSMTRRYRDILPGSLSRYHKFPSFDKCPAADFTELSSARALAKKIPEGNWVLAGSVADMYVLQSERPAVCCIRLTRKNAVQLVKNEKQLLFRGAALAVWLDPFFPEEDTDWLLETINYRIEQGQEIFIANNYGHIPLLKKSGAKVIIAGPWLYMFNSYSAHLLLDAGAELIMLPYEISKQNMNRIIETVPAVRLIPILFSYPPLFTIRGSVQQRLAARAIYDRDGAIYEIYADEDRSVVIPGKPFSLADRASFLRKEGFARFLIDLEYTSIKKPVYKRIMQAVMNGTVLPETGRFNWKDGFWQAEETGIKLHNAQGVTMLAKPKTEKQKRSR